MPKNQKGFISLTVIAVMTLVIIAAAGFWVYSKNQDKTTITDAVKNKTLTVLAVGDIACDPNDPNFNNGDGKNGVCQHKKVAELMQAENANAIVLLGDIQYDNGSLGAFEKSFVPVYKNLTAPLIVAACNHDWQNGNLDGYISAFEKYFPNSKIMQDNKTYFSTDIGDWKVYILDSDCEYVGGCGSDSVQYAWFKSELSKSTAKCSIVAWHHPVFTSGLHRKNNDLLELDDLYSLSNENKVDVMLVGHDHNYERFARQNLDGSPNSQAPRSFVVGTGGQKLRELTKPYANGHEFGASQHGFLKINLAEQTFSWQFVNIGKQILDSGSDECR